MPSRVAPRGSIGTCCHASVRGCSDWASVNSPALRKPVAPASAVLASCIVACLLYCPIATFRAYLLAIQGLPCLGKVLEKRHRDEEPDRQVSSNTFPQRCLLALVCVPRSDLWDDAGSDEYPVHGKGLLFSLRRDWNDMVRNRGAPQHSSGERHIPQWDGVKHVHMQVGDDFRAGYMVGVTIEPGEIIGDEKVRILLLDEHSEKRSQLRLARMHLAVAEVLLNVPGNLQNARHSLRFLRSYLLEAEVDGCIWSASFTFGQNDQCYRTPPHGEMMQESAACHGFIIRMRENHEHMAEYSGIA